MKAIRSFIGVLALCLTSFNTLSQEAVIKIDSNKRLTVEQVFDLIRERTNHTFIYQENLFENAPMVSLNKGTIDVVSLLEKSLFFDEIDYTISGDGMILLEKKLVNQKQKVQDTSKVSLISGVVTDENNEPLIGVNVYIKGTVRGVLTDLDGKYSIDVLPDEILVFSYIGFETVEITPDNQSVLDIKLAQDVTVVDAVVVTGYQTLSRERSAGSFAKANAATIGKRNDFNILSSVETLLPGVLTSPEGEITIRGRSTINANTDPLVVVDGFPIERSIESINQNNIESITVLKDASAASIWGVRASNGVIIIETKRGKGGRKKGLDIDFRVVSTLKPTYDFSKLPITTPRSFIDFEFFKVDNDLIFSGVSNPRTANSPIVDTYSENVNDGTALGNSLIGINAQDEFSDLFLHNVVSSQYAFNISGQSDKSLLRASFSYDKQGQEFKGNESERYTFDVFQLYNPTPSLRVEVGLNYVVNNTQNNGLGLKDLNQLLPYQRIVDDDGGYIPQAFGLNKKDTDNLLAAGFPYDWDYNLLREQRNKSAVFNNSIINPTVRLNYSIFDGLNVTLGYQYESGRSSNETLSNEETYFVRNTVNSASHLETDGTITSAIPAGQIFRQSFGSFYSHVVRSALNYDGTIVNDDHEVVAIAGGEVRENGSENSSLPIQYAYDPQSLQVGIVSNTEKYIDVFGNSKQPLRNRASFSKTLNRFVSFFSNVGYTYKGKYSVNGSYRIDKTNLFGRSPEFNDVALWSVGTNWLLHEESFFNVSFVDRLSLRGSYGTNGNVDPTTSPFLTAKIATEASTNQIYAFVSNPANPLLRFEKTATTNFGVDFSMLEHRLNGSMEYYRRVSTDLLGNAVINSTYGFNNASINFASLVNKGVEARLTGTIIDRDLKWKSTINFSTNKNEVTEVESPQENVGSFLSVQPRIGDPLDYLYSFTWAGLSPVGLPQILDENGEVVDPSTDVTDASALNYEGTSTPRYYGSLVNEVQYKGFSLTVNFSYRLGHKFRVPTIQYVNLINENGTLLHEDWEKRWFIPGDEANTDVPAPPTDLGITPIFDRYVQNSDNKIQSASTIRFRELILTYELPKKILHTNFTVGLQLRNLAVIKFNEAGLDPEYLFTTGAGLSDLSFSPRPEYSISIKGNF